MQSFKRKSVAEWDDGDKMVFALSGLSNVTTRALHEALCPPCGWTDDYPDRLLSDIEHWVGYIRELRVPR